MSTNVNMLIHDQVSRVAECHNALAAEQRKLEEMLSEYRGEIFNLLMEMNLKQKAIQAELDRAKYSKYLTKA